ncbi:MAG TPA: hypothetical protein VG841_10055 [Caulobacterales bacterium]|nr:hypothetical protein [Caulobacterales bacterium]
MLRRTFAVAVLAGAATPALGQTLAPPPPPPDPPRPEARHANADEALDALQRRRWRRVSDIVAGLPPDSASALLDDLSDMTEVNSHFDAIAGQRMGRTLLGALELGWGWRFRGHGWSSQVRPNAFAEFQTRLTRARDQLAAALVEDANDGVAASTLISVQLGLEDVDAIRTAFRSFEAASRKPVYGYSAYANAVSEKWFGSQQEMLIFARSHAASLPPASQALVAMAHTESMFRLAQSENPQVAATAENYLKEARVLHEIYRASNAFDALPPPTDRYRARFAWGHFSFAFYMAGEHNAARPYMQALGDVPAGAWTRFDDNQLFEGARRELGLSTL